MSLVIIVSFAWLTLAQLYNDFVSMSASNLNSILCRGWSNGSVVEHIGCPSKGPGFDLQHAHGGSYPSVILVRGGGGCSTLLFSPCHYAHRAQAYIQAKHSHRQNNKTTFKKFKEFQNSVLWVTRTATAALSGCH